MRKAYRMLILHVNIEWRKVRMICIVKALAHFIGSTSAWRVEDVELPDVSRVVADNASQKYEGMCKWLSYGRFCSGDIVMKSLIGWKLVRSSASTTRGLLQI